VTGGGQGIGKAIAKRLLKDGLQVIIAELDQEAGEEAEIDLKHFGTVEFIRTDVANEEMVGWCGRLDSRFGHESWA
jgi:NAD(P)-dependent dehydrogenase (short-subunit alcohol dehydrogenase family)